LKKVSSGQFLSKRPPLFLIRASNVPPKMRGPLMKQQKAISQSNGPLKNRGTLPFYNPPQDSPGNRPLFTNLPFHLSNSTFLEANIPLICPPFDPLREFKPNRGLISFPSTQNLKISPSSNGVSRTYSAIYKTFPKPSSSAT